MSLFGGAKKTAQAETPATVKNLSVQQSCQGSAIPVVYGTAKLPGNLIWYGDFTAVPHVESSQAGGGKGGGGGETSSTTSYTYTTSFAFGLAAGAIMDVARVWWGKAQYDLANLPGSATLLRGESGQEAWSYLVALHGDEALGYSGLAHIGVAHADLGTSSSLPNILYEVLGKGPAAAVEAVAVGHRLDLSRLAGPWPSDVAAIAAVLPTPPASGTQAVFDTSPAFCLYDLVTDQGYGAGLPPSLIEGLGDYAAWCQSMGLTMSVALTEAEAANQIAALWLQTTLAEAVWSGGKLKIVPYADEAVALDATEDGGGGYRADLTPVMAIDDSLMLADGGDPPLTVTRADPADAYNRISVEYLDRAFAYNTAVVTADDPASIALYGRRDAPVISAHHITSAAVAQRVADMLRDRSVHVLGSCRWRMGPMAALLEPMDLVSITDEAQGLASHLVRITEIDEEDDTVFTVTAEDVPGSLVKSAERPLPASLGFAADFNLDPGPVNTPIMFEPPDALTDSGLELWVALSGGSHWGGAEVWVSLDGDSYSRVGRVTAPARQGVLASLLGSADDGFTVDLGESRGQLSSVSEIDAALDATLCRVDGELLTYQDADLVGTGLYALKTLRRGLHGTQIGSHAVGADFVRLDDALFKYPFGADYIGRTIQLKFVSFNIWGGGLQDIAGLPSYSFTLRGAALTSPLPDVQGLTTAFVAGITNLTWQAVQDFRSVDYEIRQGPTPASAQMIGRTALTQAPSFGDGNYWVAAHYQLPGGQDVYSEHWAAVVVAGAQLSANVLAGYDEAATNWSGSASGVLAVGGLLRLPGAGDMALAADIASIGDVANFGGIAASGSYCVPTSHRIDAGRVCAASVLMSVGARGVSVFDDIAASADVGAISDVSGATLGPAIAAVPQIRLSQDGSVWGPWTDWMPGSYQARVFDFRVMLATSDAQVIPELTGFAYRVDVPDRMVSFTNLAIPAMGAAILYDGPFNGGPNGAAIPNLQVTIVGAHAGDDVLLSVQSLAGFSVQVLNGGVGVARSLNIIAQGY